MVEVRGWTVLSSHERRIWADIERCHDAAADTEEPTTARPGTPHPHRPDVRSVDDLPALAVAGIWAGIVLVLCGLVVAGLAVGAVTTLGALLWRHVPRG
jgi:ferric-dicitrate binding protein FerR (iron transport regulator)